MKITAWVSLGFLACAGFQCLPIPDRTNVEASIEWIDLGNNASGLTEATAMSGDGSTVVGWYEAEAGEVAFRWKDGAVITLDPLPGALGCQATAVSDDGSVVVGTCQFTDRRESFRWTAASGTVGLGQPVGDARWSDARDLTGDGSVVVGTYWLPQSGSEYHAFRWTSDTGFQDMADELAGVCAGGATAISRDGSTLVTVQCLHAFTDGFAPTVTALPSLTNDVTYNYVIANAVSADGSTVVGESDSSLGRQAFHWTPTTGMVGLGDLPGGDFFSTASAVSGDGSVVVGKSLIWPIDQMDGESPDSSRFQYKAFIWDSAHGMEDLKAVLISSCGQDISTSTLIAATGISDDGQTVVGWGLHGNGVQNWIVRLPEDWCTVCPSCADPAPMLGDPVSGVPGYIVYLNAQAQFTPTLQRLLDTYDIAPIDTFAHSFSVELTPATLAVLRCDADVSSVRYNWILNARGNCSNPLSLLGDPDPSGPGQFAVVFTSREEALRAAVQYGLPQERIFDNSPIYGGELAPDVVAALRCDPGVATIEFSFLTEAAQP